jgi:hypothetical protein
VFDDLAHVRIRGHADDRYIDEGGEVGERNR